MIEQSGFDTKNKEYVIPTPYTPLPWINYIGNDNLQGIISQTAGGYTFYKDAGLMRMTRYRYNSAPLDTDGRIIYIKKDDTIFSPTYKPCFKEPEQYECRHGLGYTKITSKNEGIESQLTFFIPLDDNVEIWDLKLTNTTKKTTKLQIFPYVEFALWNAIDDMTNFQRNFSTGEVLVENNTIFHITEYRERRNHFAFFTSNLEPHSFETKRDDFIGKQNLLNEPQMVQNGELKHGIAHGWAPCAIFQYNITLKPGEEKRIIFQLGYFENPSDKKFINNKINLTDVNLLIEKYKQHKNINESFLKLKHYWNSLLNNYTVESQNFSVNTMVNIWNQYQNIITYKMSRSASFFESGIGRGMGFRDSNQDLLGFMHIFPKKARERIYDLASTQLQNGHAYHQYQPLTKKGNHSFGSNYNDDPLWLVMSVSAYLKETGDFSFLEEVIPYENNKELSTPLYEHLIRALTFTTTHKGPHGLPLIGRADWNDCLNLNTRNKTPGLVFSEAPSTDGKTAESILIGFLFVYAGKEFLKIAKKLNDKKNTDWITKEIKKMETSLNEYGWDGKWWVRAYDNASKKIGSKENTEGQIYIEPQGWAVMAEFPDRDKLKTALNSVNERLNTKHGIMLLQPAYSQYDINIGEITTYPPGYKENAGIFCHTNPWVIIGEALLGNYNRAFEYYLKINPAEREKKNSTHRCEPYVYAQMIAGKDAPTFGEAKNSWLTGTASWNFVAISQYLLGIKPEFDGLHIDPGVPDNFGDYTVHRNFRNCLYHIHIKFITNQKSYIEENNKKKSGTFIFHDINKKERIIRAYINRSTND